MGGGVREDGILQVSDTGSGGPSTPVNITAPLGPNTAANSVSVTLATDEDPIPVIISDPVDQGEPNPDVGDAWPIKVTDGVDTASVGGSNDLDVDAKALVVAGYDAPNGRIHPIPVLDNNFTPPVSNYRAVSTELRSTTVAENSTVAATGKNNFIAVGGIDNAASPAFKKLVLADGNSLSADPANTYGLQNREMGHSFVNSGSISAIGNRFTISSRFVVKAAAIFVLENTGFLGTIRPVVSVDNGVTWKFTNAFNIESGAFASSFVDAAVDGAYVIPFGAGATDYGFEVTARTAGSIACKVSANSTGLSSLFAAATIIGNSDVNLHDEAGNGIASLSISGAGRGIQIHTGRSSGDSLAIGTPMFPIAGINASGSTLTPIAATNGAPNLTAMGLVTRRARTLFTTSAPTVSSVGVASAQAVASAITRQGLVLRNLSNARISLGFGSPAVLDSGVTLYPRDTYYMGDYDFDVGAVNAIASAAASSLAIQQYLA